MKALLVSIFCLFALAVQAEDRTFTNTDGKKITASVDTVREGKVYLMVEGKRFEVPFKSLIEEDQTYLRKWVKENFNFKFTFREKAVEDVSTRKSEGSGKTRKKSSVWTYEVQIDNRSGVDVEDLRVAYRMVVRATKEHDPAEGKKSKKETAQITKGEVKIASLPNTDSSLVTTKPVTCDFNSWQKKTTISVSTCCGGTDVIDAWNNHEFERVLDGIWLKIYKGDRLISEYKSQGKLLKDLVWK